MKLESLAMDGQALAEGSANVVARSPGDGGPAAFPGGSAAHETGGFHAANGGPESCSGSARNQPEGGAGRSEPRIMRANPFAGKHLAGRGCLQTAARSGSIVLITFTASTGGNVRRALSATARVIAQIAA